MSREDKGPTLFDIQMDFMTTGRALEEGGGDVEGIDKDALDRFFESSEALPGKVNGYLWLISSLREKAEGYDKHAKRLNALKSKANKKADFLHNRLQQFMEGTGLEEIATQDFGDVRLVNTGGAAPVEIDKDADPAAIMEVYPDLVTQKPMPAPTFNKRAIAAALKSGVELAFAVSGVKKRKLKY